jgi:hypothetical protein
MDSSVPRYPPVHPGPLDLSMEEEESLLGIPTLLKHHRKPKFQFPTPRFRTAIAFVVTALFSGLLFYFILFSLVFSRPSLHALSKGYLYDDPYTVTVYSPPLPTNLDARPPGLNVDGLLEKNPDELRAMIATTNGYFVRDWSLYLGWNNVSEHRLRRAQNADLTEDALYYRSSTFPCGTPESNTCYTFIYICPSL